MSSRHSILIIEDDPVSRAMLAAYLRSEGYRLREAQDAAGMRAALADGLPDLVMLDINLPGEDGFTLLRELRRSSDVAVIVVSARTDPIDRIVMLEMGADDYVSKPYVRRELLARVRGLIRRSAPGHGAGGDAYEVKRFSGWTFDLARRQLTSPDGEKVRLTGGEFELLRALTASRGRVMTRDRLLDALGDHEREVNDRTVDVLVGRLRRKLADDPHDARMIVTVHGQGYLFAG